MQRFIKLFFFNISLNCVKQSSEDSRNIFCADDVWISKGWDQDLRNTNQLYQTIIYSIYVLSLRKSIARGFMHSLEGFYKQGKTLKKLHLLPPSMQCSGNQNNKRQTNTKPNLWSRTLSRREFSLYYKHNAYVKKISIHTYNKGLTEFF